MRIVWLLVTKVVSENDSCFVFVFAWERIACFCLPPGCCFQVEGLCSSLMSETMLWMRSWWKQSTWHVLACLWCGCCGGPGWWIFQVTERGCCVCEKGRCEPLLWERENHADLRLRMIFRWLGSLSGLVINEVFLGNSDMLCWWLMISYAFDGC